MSAVISAMAPLVVLPTPLFFPLSGSPLYSSRMQGGLLQSQSRVGALQSQPRGGGLPSQTREEEGSVSDPRALSACPRPGNVAHVPDPAVVVPVVIVGQMYNCIEGQDYVQISACFERQDYVEHSCVF